MHAIVMLLPTGCGWMGICSELTQVGYVQNMETWPFKGLVKVLVHESCLHICSIILQWEEFFNLKIKPWLNIYLDVVYKKLQLKGHRRGLCSDIVHYSSSNLSIQSVLDSVIRLTCSGNKGFRRLQEPPSFQSPPSKCLGDWVRKNLIAPGFSLFSTNITCKKHNNYKLHNEIACIGLVLYTQKRL